MGININLQTEELIRRYNGLYTALGWIGNVSHKNIKWHSNFRRIMKRDKTHGTRVRAHGKDVRAHGKGIKHVKELGTIEKKI